MAQGRWVYKKALQWRRWKGTKINAKGTRIEKKRCQGLYLPPSLALSPSLLWVLVIRGRAGGEGKGSQHCSQRLGMTGRLTTGGCLKVVGKKSLVVWTSK